MEGRGPRHSDIPSLYDFPILKQAKAEYAKLQ
jgi:hypothetical protein